MTKEDAAPDKVDFEDNHEVCSVEGIETVPGNVSGDPDHRPRGTEGGEETQRAKDGAGFGRHEWRTAAHELNSRNPSRMSLSVARSSPSRPTTRATAAEAWALE